VLSVPPALGGALPQWLPDLERARHQLLPLPVEPPALGGALPQWLPDLERARHQLLPLPVEPPAEWARRGGGPEIVLGYAGRIVREHKRLDRRPAFLRALDATGLRYRFEVLGDGALRPELEREVGGRVRFHGWTTKDEFWRVLARWDGLVFFTEVEGGPIALLEGMAVGAIPFYPRIGGSTGDLYAPRVDAACYYPPGDLVAAARGVREIFSREAASIAVLRDRSRAAVAGHTRANYGGTLENFLRQIAAFPRVSRAGAPARRWADPLPLGLVTRAARSLLRHG
jgi:glycosyltransferase involved in cell wall biosynthesis